MRSMVNRSLIVLGLLLLVAALVNLLVALTLVVPARGRMPGLPVAMDTGPAAAAHRWPEAPPHAQPWPAITHWQMERTFGHRRFLAHAGQHQMQTDTYGWPLPVLIESNRWWPWEDPAWKSSVMPELAMRPVWSGV